VIITAGAPGEQLCWSEPWTRFSARTGQGEEAHPDHADRTGLSGPSLIVAELPHHDRRGENSITESRPNPTRAIEDAITPAATATAASAVIHAMLAYSSQNPRRRSRAR